MKPPRLFFSKTVLKEGDAVFGNHGLGKIHLSSPEVTSSFLLTGSASGLVTPEKEEDEVFES